MYYSVDAGTNRLRVAVAQLGARMHYAVPRQLHEHSMLEHLYTDITGAKSWPRLLHSVPVRLRPNGLKRLLERQPHGIPPHKITAFSSFGWSYVQKLAAARTSEEKARTCLWAGEELGRRALAQGIERADAVYTFNSAGLMILRAARKHGAFAVVEQTIAPRYVERALLHKERCRFPMWEEDHSLNEGAAVEAFIEREKEEWDVADCIVCGSAFVRDMIGEAGGPVEKCEVVPYGVNLSRLSANRVRSPRGGALRVLFVGGVGLRKGIPYVAETARLLGGKAHVRVVGPVHLSKEGVRRLAAQVEVVGPVPRSEIVRHYAWADVFLLPSVCEGSATVTYEALAMGLPVVCTPNTGSVVRNGKEGFVVPAGDAVAIAERLNRLRDPELRAMMSKQACQRAGYGSEGAYGERLTDVFEKGLHDRKENYAYQTGTSM